MSLSPSTARARPPCLLATIALLAVASGCRLIEPRAEWREPPAPQPQRDLATALLDGGGQWGGVPTRDWVARRQGEFATSQDPRLAAELALAFADRAAQADHHGEPAAVDHYFLATSYAWVALQTGSASARQWCQTWQIYHASLARLLAVSAACHRYVPGQGLLVCLGGEMRLIPLACRGFAWNAADFQQLFPVGTYVSNNVSRPHRTAGWGVPLVVRRVTATGQYAEERFLLPRTVFSATALLRPNCAALASGDAGDAPAVLELENPLALPSRSAAELPVAFATDKSAMFAFQEYVEPRSRDWWTLFLTSSNPTTGETGLFFLEPYQPGKIPVVLAHGLLSNQSTWVDMVNDLRTCPEFAAHYQIWGYRYATGRPFLHSAAQLRRDLHLAIHQCEVTRDDPALHRAVLVGHSMGGLIAKLQVVATGDHLWQAVARQPLEALVAEESMRERLQWLFFFDPQPAITRVVYIATPHRGSPWADVCVGRIGDRLVRVDRRERAAHDQLIQANPGVFRAELAERMPTSIDLLEQESCLLQAIHDLPLAASVRAHSIIGVGSPVLCRDDGDGAVAVESARIEGVVSERFVAARHSMLQRHPETIAEVRRILAEHWQEYQAAQGTAAPSETDSLPEPTSPAGDDRPRPGESPDSPPAEPAPLPAPLEQ